MTLSLDVCPEISTASVLMGKESDMTTNDAVRPVAWIPTLNLRELEEVGECSVFLMDKESVMDGCIRPLYPHSSIAHLQARVEALTGESARIERENIEGWKQAAHWRAKAEAAERRVARLEKELYEDRAELLSCRMNIAADLHKGNNAWEGVPQVVDARVKAITDVLTQPEADHG
jgi:hypothetical protein